MAGPQDIQRVPRGLIDLLGMRATGQTPGQLDATVSGSIELLEFYLNDRTQVFAGNSGAIIAPGVSPVAGLVPAGQLWLLFGLTLSSGLSPAATGADITGGILRNPAGINAYFALTERQNWAAQTTMNVGAHFERPVILQPGDQFAVRCSGIFVAAPALAVAVTAYYAAIHI